MAEWRSALDEPPMTPAFDLCEVGECEARASWCVTGRWTVFDWLDVYVCGEHLVAAHKYLALRTVDGEPCLEQTSTYLDGGSR